MHTITNDDGVIQIRASISTRDELEELISRLNARLKAGIIKETKDDDATDERIAAARLATGYGQPAAGTAGCPGPNIAAKQRPPEEGV